MIQTIIFDLSEVLIAGLLGVERQLAPRVGRPKSDVLDALGGPRLEALCCGRLSEDQFLAQILAEQQWDVTVGELKAVIRRNLERPVDGMDVLLEQLRQRYELVLLSDHAAEWVTHIRSVHPFLEAFSAQYFSYELGMMKREAATFETVLAGMGRTPDVCLFIDDSAANVRVARSVGIDSIQFVGALQLAARLAAKGLTTPPIP